jgi:hypothetical protein
MAGPVGRVAGIRVGPGRLLLAPLGTPEPVDLTTAWNAAWFELGYTDAGTTFTYGGTFEDVPVAEELDPIMVLQTARNVNVSVAAAENTAKNLQIAFNGGTIDVAGVGFVTFEPLDAGIYTELMLGWEADDNKERYLVRRVINTGEVAQSRGKAPAKSMLPMTFRGLVPASGAKTFKAFIHDDIGGTG